MDFAKFVSICACIVGLRAAQLPSYITPCTRSLPYEELSECVVKQARIAQPYFAKGVPELNLEPLDPLALNDINAKAGTFTIKSTNVILQGLGKVDVRALTFNWAKNKGHTKIFGNFTLVSDYVADGRVLIVPITGNGKLTVNLYDTEILLKYKVRRIKGEDGFEHLESFDWKPSYTFGNVKLHISNLLGGNEIGEAINQVVNENWRDVMNEVGLAYIQAICDKVLEVINKMYLQIPFDELTPP